MATGAGRPWEQEVPEPELAERRDAYIERLREFSERSATMKAERWLLVKGAREAGVTWAAIGDALGVTRQRAQQILTEGDRFSKGPMSEVVQSALRRHLDEHPAERSALESALANSRQTRS